jgi:hypothetical protein
LNPGTPLLKLTGFTSEGTQRLGTLKGCEHFHLEIPFFPHTKMPTPIEAPGGWVKDQFDPNDRPYVCRRPGELRKYVDFSVTGPASRDQWLLPVYNQFETGTCVANSTAAAFRYLAWKLKAELKDDASAEVQVTTEPSRAFIYYHARFLEMKEEQGL